MNKRIWKINKNLEDSNDIKTRFERDKKSASIYLLDACTFVNAKIL